MKPIEKIPGPIFSCIRIPGRPSGASPEQDTSGVWHLRMASAQIMQVAHAIALKSQITPGMWPQKSLQEASWRVFRSTLGRDTSGVWLLRLASA